MWLRPFAHGCAGRARDDPGDGCVPGPQRDCGRGVLRRRPQGQLLWQAVARPDCTGVSGRCARTHARTHARMPLVGLRNCHLSLPTAPPTPHGRAAASKAPSFRLARRLSPGAF
eukprot:366029-Chlamydomonas_euryale.AAC.16